MPEDEVPQKKIKLLAIRPLEKCTSTIKRVLVDGKIYQFYNDYTFNFSEPYDNHSDTISISYKPTIPEDLYYTIEKETSSINISAIVGKNGSGKSSIVELLYAACYNIALHEGLLPAEDEDGNKLELVKKLNVELYYQLGDDFVKIKLKDNKITLEIQENGKTKFTPQNGFGKDYMQKYFFYTIAINYSHHALNAKHLGLWVNQVFHKNDGYQTPIVLNPYRKNGDIKINTEELLTLSRLLFIILTPLDTSAENKQKYYRELSPGKHAEAISIVLNPEKIAFKKDEQYIKKLLLENNTAILNTVFSSFGINPPEPYNTRNNYLRYAYAYVRKKVYSISQKYKRYQKEDLIFIKSGNKSSKKARYDHAAFDNFIKEILADKSHITFKLRQAIFFINNYNEYSEFIGKKKINKLDKLADFLNGKKKEERLIDVLPPSFFKYDLYFEEGGTFQQLSSGEKQRIFISASYIYHIINLHSVKDDGTLIKYPYINIILDEIELYYHPELQQTFINDFISNIRRLAIPEVLGINCLFITHSPFILSDIPNANILFLEKQAQPINHKDALGIDTFGANVHDLLKHSFFLENGSMGEFAKDKISSTIDFLNLGLYKSRLSELKKLKTGSTNNNEEINRLEQNISKLNVKNMSWEYHQQIINMIGEPVLKKKLQSMFDQVLYSDEASYIKHQIKELENKLNELG